MTTFKKLKKIILQASKPSIKFLDDLCREVVRLRDKYTCRRCGKSKKQGWKIEWAHFYSRAIKVLRWDLDNSMMLCFDCHYNFGHKQPREFAKFWRETIGDKKMDALTLRKNNSKVDRNAVKLYLLQEKKKYE